MNVFLPDNPKMEPVPRDTVAPWLSPNSDKWRLLYDWTLYIDGYEWMVPAGYVTDLSSIPRPAWWLFPRGYTPARRAAVFHDYLYSHGHKWCTKAYADAAFKAIMLEDGASYFISSVFHAFVRANTHGGGW